MLMKQSSLLVFTIILLNYMNNECEAFRCYSCSDCSDATRLTWNKIDIVGNKDQCIKTTISTGENGQGRTIIGRGASSTCNSYNGTKISVYCCSTDLCNV